MMNHSNSPESSEPRADRRQFFLRGLSKTIEGLLGAVQKASPVLAAGLAARGRDVLRPPRALAETEFLRTCYRCGSCVDACPVQAIRPVQGSDEEIAGTPHLDPDLRACEMCRDLPCVQACPSGALARGHSDQPVRIGLARWEAEHCLRAAGQACQICLERCPVGLATLHVNPRGQIEILAEQCTGCGVCQQVCPARPKAIHVQPL